MTFPYEPDPIDPREPFADYDPCWICHEHVCLCENRWDVEPDFFDE